MSFPAGTWPGPGGPSPGPGPSLDPSNPIHAGAIAGAVVSISFIGAFIGLYAYGYRRGYFNPRVKLVRADLAKAYDSQEQAPAQKQEEEEVAEGAASDGGGGKGAAPVVVETNAYRSAVIAQAIATNTSRDSEDWS